ncbi:MAG: hypothetical protein KDK39_11815 [Leptospiraceae bacterium]|nr:hypothetical protein [Leptospiraceae bacterium]
MKKLIIYTIIFIVAASCAQHWGNLKRISADIPKGNVATEQVVAGKHCKYFSTMRTPSTVEDALNVALADNPGVVGIKDVEIEFYRQTFLQYWCVTVTGKAVKAK